MKFINYLESITGVGIYPLASFVLFFVFFCAVTIYVMKTDKKTIQEISNIPLEQ